MKVIRIKKSYRNGTKEHFLVLLNDSQDNIDYLVEDWCESEPSGMNYGYSFEWSFVEDEKLIKSILKDKIKLMNNQIETLKNKKCEMEKYLVLN